MAGSYPGVSATAPSPVSSSARLERLASRRRAAISGGAAVDYDPGTGFPRWRYVREHGAGWLDMEHKMTADALATRDAERLARKLGKLISDVRPGVLTAALRLLSAETALKNDPDTAELMAAALDVDGADF